MTTLYAFTEAWYAGFIDQVKQSIPEEASPDAYAHAVAMLNAAAMIAQAIDNAFGQSAQKSECNTGSGSVVQAIDSLRSGLEDLADEIIEVLSKSRHD